MMAWYDGIVSGLSEVTDWIGDNPEATMLLGGLASGVAQGYENHKDREWQRDQLERMERFKERKASSGDNGYGSHSSNLAGGTGLLANPNYIKKP